MGEILDLNTIAKVDKANMLELLMRFPEMCEEALSAEVELPAVKPTNVVVTGMGGSGIVGDILKDWLDLNVPFAVCKSYKLPAWVDERTLVVAVSYSGNTDETLACVSEAVEKKAQLVAITSGGKLAEICKKLGKPCIRIPSGLAPRAALPYSLFSAILAFKKLGLAADKDGEIKESIELLKKMRGEMDPKHENNQAEKIARVINGTLPVIYAPIHLEAVALRLKNQFSENSKIMSKTEFFPELCHNEIVGLNSAPKNSSFLFMRDTEENEQMKKQIEFTERLLKGKNPITMQTRGKGRLARILSLVYLGDFISFYLAILRGVDPTPVPEIERLKAEKFR
jgi:glucose/mannose-6-phosphate isomerase